MVMHYCNFREEQFGKFVCLLKIPAGKAVDGSNITVLRGCDDEICEGCILHTILDLLPGLIK